MPFEPNCLPTALGSLPLTDVRAACELVLKHFRQIPMWPQLPRRTFYESMYVQYSEGLPGAVFVGDTIRVDRNRVEEDLEELYIAYLDNQVGDGYGAISAEYAAGLAALLAMPERLATASALKGHITGPISLGLQITDMERRPILYDEILADAVAKLLRMKATWQEKALRRMCPQTITFVDEPYLASFGSAYLPISREQVITAIEEVLCGLVGLKGIHCCGNTDWSVLLATCMDIISFDAYHYAAPFALYAGEIKSFLRRGGSIAWGIVPNDAEALEQETVDSLVEKLLAAMNLLVEKGIPLDTLLPRSFITAACGLGALPAPVAVKACELTAGVSAAMRQKYFGAT